MKLLVLVLAACGGEEETTAVPAGEPLPGYVRSYTADARILGHEEGQPGIEWVDGLLLGRGDADGDGVNDVIVVDEADWADDGQGEAAVLLFAGPIAPGDASVEDGLPLLVDTAHTDARVWNAAWAGDVDGDGLDELLACADGHDLFGDPYLYLAHGPFDGPLDAADADLRLPLDEYDGAPIAYEPPRRALDGGRDADGDGLDDILVAEPDRPVDGATGAVYLLRGPATGLASVLDADLVVAGTAAAEHAAAMGALLVGDLTGDGLPDLAVIAEADGGAEALVAVLSAADDGQRTLDDRDAALRGLTPGWWLGMTSAELDGDGLDDLVVAEPDRVPSRVGLYPGPLAGELQADDHRAWAFDDSGIGRVDWFYTGRALDAGGDLDADGWPDLLLGTEDYNGFSLWSNSAYRGEGATFACTRLDDGCTGVEDADLRMAGFDFGTFGHQVVHVGDVSADGIDDLLVGAPLSDDSSFTLGNGAAYLWFGRPDFADELMALAR